MTQAAIRPQSATHPALPPFDYAPPPYTGPSKGDVLAMRREFLTPALITYYRDPVMIVDGRMQYLFDEKGRRYLDAIAGIVSVSVGHCHPKVMEAVREQNERLQHTTTIYLHPTIGLFGKKLAEHMPAGMDLTVTYFTNGGSEANELAILMDREFTGRSEIISLRNCYHGGTQGTMGLTAIGTWKFPSNPPSGVKNAMPGYCYRCPYGLTYPSCDVRCARDVEQVVRLETSGQPACFIAEPIQGVGGAVTPPPEYFQIVYDIVRRHGGSCIADEVQTGFGRIGTHFWGFGRYGVVPDIVVLGKPIGNGYPLAATVTRRDLIEAARLNTSPHSDTIARGHKVNKEEMRAMMVAVETYIKRDHEADWREWEKRAKRIADSVSAIKTVTTEIWIPEIANHVPHLKIRWDPDVVKITVADVVTQLRDGDPSIEVVPGSREELTVGVWMMQPGDAQLVARRIREVLKSAA